MIGYWQQPVVRPSVRLSVWWERQRRNGMVETSNVILKALTEFLRNLCNGNGKTATAERQRNAGNQALGHSQHSTRCCPAMVETYWK